MMIQALAALFFAALTLAGIATIAALLHADWQAFVAALGFGRQSSPAAPLSPRYRVRSVRRAPMIRLEAIEAPRRAVA